MKPAQAIVVRAAVAGGTADDLNLAVDNPDHPALRAVIDVTDHDPDGNAGAMTVTIEHVDPASGKHTTLLASASIATVSTTVLTVGPGIAVTSNVSANVFLPKNLNVKIDHTNTHPMVYTVGLELIG